MKEADPVEEINAPSEIAVTDEVIVNTQESVVSVLENENQEVLTS